MHSEPTGTANWLEKGGKGLQVTARKEGNEWIVNGEKVAANTVDLLCTANTVASSGQRTRVAGISKEPTWPALCADRPRMEAHKIRTMIQQTTSLFSW